MYCKREMYRSVWLKFRDVYNLVKKVKILTIVKTISYIKTLEVNVKDTYVGYREI